MAEKYSVTSELRGGVEVFVLREAEEARAEIAPSLGNNCFAFQAAAPILEPVEFDEFQSKPTSFGIPVLFPFPNRIRDGVFSFRGRSFRVDPPRHGFVRDKAWRVELTGATAEEGAWIKSSIDAANYSDQILAQFPYPFRLEVIYRLKDSALEMEATARNTGDEDMPAGYGIHPYFRRPDQGSIQVPARKRWELADSLPTGRLLDAEGSYDLREPRDLNALSLDDIFTDSSADADGLTRCRLNDIQASSQVVVEFDPKVFPHIVVYTPPAPRRAICIEPNTCPTDAFNLQERGIESNLLVLRPGEAATFKVRFYIRPIPPHKRSSTP
ncbi:MAG TPA: aldose 1-epimerase [Blastocatellia bacterium]|nr:aldose 1-epimerase [Blastocatellia bacterium]